MLNAPAVLFDGVSKRFGAQSVLAELSLELRAGESLALVGANGAGKTTCIKILLDFVHADAGHVQLFGVDHRRPDSRARLAFLPERFLPPFHLTGHEFLDYMGRLHGGRPRPGRAELCAREMGLASDALRRAARSYSKGMSQKLGLAACLASGKDLLVLDEPMSGLDPGARATVRARLDRLREEGRSLFFSTHVLADVEAICDRLAILHRGRVVFCGTPSACRRRYDAPDLEQAYLACVEAGADRASFAEPDSASIS